MKRKFKLNWKKAWLPMTAMALLDMLCMGVIIGCEIFLENPSEYDGFKVLFEYEDITIRIIDMAIIFEFSLVLFTLFTLVKTIFSILFDYIYNKCRKEENDTDLRK